MSNPAVTTVPTTSPAAYKPLLTATWAKPLARADLGVIARYVASEGSDITITVEDLADYPRRSETLQALVERASNEHGSLVEQMLVTLDAAYATIHQLRHARNSQRKATTTKAKA